MTASATPSDQSEESGDTEQVDRDDSTEDTSSADSGQNGGGRDDGRMVLDRSDESQDFVDQSVIDFDPDDGLYSGTAVTGDTDIPGAHVGEDGKVHDDGSAEAAAARGEAGDAEESGAGSADAEESDAGSADTGSADDDTSD